MGHNITCLFVLSTVAACASGPAGTSNTSTKPPTAVALQGPASTDQKNTETTDQGNAKPGGSGPAQSGSGVQGGQGPQQVGPGQQQTSGSQARADSGATANSGIQMGDQSALNVGGIQNVTYAQQSAPTDPCAQHRIRSQSEEDGCHRGCDEVYSREIVKCQDPGCRGGVDGARNNCHQGCSGMKNAAQLARCWR